MTTAYDEPVAFASRARTLVVRAASSVLARGVVVAARRTDPWATACVVGAAADATPAGRPTVTVSRPPVSATTSDDAPSARDRWGRGGRTSTSSAGRWSTFRHFALMSPTRHPLCRDHGVRAGRR